MNLWLRKRPTFTRFNQLQSAGRKRFNGNHILSLFIVSGQAERSLAEREAA